MVEVDLPVMEGYGRGHEERNGLWAPDTKK
jgi:hypothetical protein